jgi:uncharacterized protein
MERAGTLSANIAEFCAWLRREHQFLAGPAEVLDALRTVDIVGVDEPERFRRGLRLTLCSKPEEREIFDQAFDAFFLNPARGHSQRLYSPRHTRERGAVRQAAASDIEGKRGERAEVAADTGGRRRGALEAEQPGPPAADALSFRARYSPHAQAGGPPAISAKAVRGRLSDADRLMASVRLGRLRRWRPSPKGTRFDLRRTLRGSLHTGGDAVALRFLGHPPRNPRFVLLVDGSRSMASHGTLVLEFACALAQRSSRTNVFFFSTTLEDVTAALRGPARHRDRRLAAVGEAWGGGTRIGQSLTRFVRDYGGRCLSDETVVIIYSDGLDVGDVTKLERAMREIHRRSACVLWVNPLAGTQGYAPSARGMQTCLPFIDAFIGVRTADDLAAIARLAKLATR